MISPTLPAVLQGLPGVAVLASGWDSDAYLVRGRIVVKVPKTPAAQVRLRREAALLAMVRPRVTLPVPDLRLVEGEALFSWHVMVPGGQLLAAQYGLLPEGARVRLGHELGQFLAELHRVGVARAVTAGAEPVQPWRAAAEVLVLAGPTLPAVLQSAAERLVQDYSDLPPDPLGQIYGHFDGHGWNMAFDHDAQVLNGIYDFADSGIGPRHQEFIHAGLVSFDLMGRAMRSYEDCSGVRLDPRRIAVLAGMHRLWELAEAVLGRADSAAYVTRFADWSDWIETGVAG